MDQSFSPGPLDDAWSPLGRAAGSGPRGTTPRRARAALSLAFLARTARERLRVRPKLAVPPRVKGRGRGPLRHDPRPGLATGEVCGAGGPRGFGPEGRVGARTRAASGSAPSVQRGRPGFHSRSASARLGRDPPSRAPPAPPAPLPPRSSTPLPPNGPGAGDAGPAGPSPRPLSVAALVAGTAREPLAPVPPHSAPAPTALRRGGPDTRPPTTTPLFAPCRGGLRTPVSRETTTPNS